MDIELAKNDMMKLDKRVKVDKDLAYLKEGTKNFEEKGLFSSENCSKYFSLGIFCIKRIGIKISNFLIKSMD